MIVLYDLINILYNMVLIYIFLKYNGSFHGAFRFSNTASHAVYVLAAISLMLIPLFITDYYIQYLAKFFVFLCAAFSHQGSRIRQIAATALFVGTSFVLDLLLILLSYKFQLRFYNYFSYNHVIYIALYLMIMFLFMQVVRFVQDTRTRKTTIPFHLLDAVSLPLASIYLLACAFLSSNHELNYAFFINVLLIIGFLIFSIYETDRRDRLINLQIEQSLILSQNEAYLNQITLLQATNSSMQKLRHDFQNHIEALQSLIDAAPASKAEEYLKKIQQEMKPDAVISDTGNPVIDSLINTKLSSCKRDNISVRYHAKIPADLNVDSFALTIILGNLLDNAIEAVKKDSCKEKRINLTLTYTRNCLVLVLKNSYDGILQFDNDCFVTSKTNSGIHGLGLKNVAQTITSKGGMLSFDYDTSSFSVTALIPCE